MYINMDKHLQLFQRIVNDDTWAYEILFKDYYSFLCSFAYGYVKERYTAEEIVEEFFADLWKNRKNLEILSSVRAYFIQSIHNRCLNYMRREKPRYNSTNDIADLIGKECSAGDKLITLQPPSLLANELEALLSAAINKLPQNCREIFLLSRKKFLSYEEISLHLNISINTVKTQMKIALSKLREELKNYLSIVILINLF